MHNDAVDSFEVFPWNENFETGIQLIDEQHKQLVHLLNKLAVHLTRQSSAIELNQIFGELAAYADLHFKTEEEIWQPHFKKDSWFAEHQHTHSSFTSKVLELKAEEGSKPLDEVIKDILKFLTHWLAFHILNSDMRMAKTLHAIESGLSLEKAKKHADREMSCSTNVLIETVLSMYDNLSSRTLDLMREKTERKRIEDALHESEKREKSFSDAVTNSVPGLLYLYDDQLRLIRWNKKHIELTGYTSEELANKCALDFFEEQHHQRILDEIKLAYEDGYAEVEEALLTKDGSLIPFLFTAVPLVIDGENYFSGIGIDITDHKLAENKLRESRDMYQQAQRAAQLGSYRLDLVADRWVSSEVMDDIAGIDASYQRDTEGWIRLMHPNEQNKMRNYLHHEILNSNYGFDQKYRIIRHSDGAERWIHDRAHLERNQNGNPILMIGTILDITEKKLAEDKLLESEKMHKEAQQLTHLGHWKLNHKNRELYWSDEVYRIFEIDPGEFEPSYDTFIDTVHSDDREFVNRAFADSIESKMPYDIEHRLQIKDGSVKWVNERCETFYDEGGNPMRSIGTVHDITERKQADQLVRKLSQAINNAGESILITDRKGIIEYANPSCEKITGYTVEEVIGQSPGMFSGGNQDAAFYTDMWNTITSGRVWRGKVINRKKDGSLYPVMLTISPIHDESGDVTRFTHFVGIQSDLTKIENLEQQFYQAQKMDAIGTLVSGVSHDFNNMLSGIMGNVYFARKKSQDRPDVIEKLDDIDTLALHAAEMIKQLLIFAREDSVEMQRVSLTSFLKQAFKLAQSAISKEISCSCNICQDELFINGDVTQIQQILMNLMNNARDALSNTAQAEIICSLSPYVADDLFLKRFPELEGSQFVHLSVRDNGSGIPAEKLDKIFEPFFTTKKAGEGTGLGLAMIYGAIQSHKGAIEVESECAKGTTFHIYLPLIN